MKNISGKDRIILPLDVSDADTAVRLVRLLRNEVGAFKVGLELVNNAGFDIFARLRDAGAEKVFYDAKFHDIPNTVAGAVRAAVKQNLWMLNVHASGGSAMMLAALEAARETADKLSFKPPLLIAVTLLTSIDETALKNELGIEEPLFCHVVRLARLAQESGLDGIVASPKETASLKIACGPEFLIITPGIRSEQSSVDDQKRVMTPREAVEAGADYLVIGRPIIRADDPVKAARDIASNI